MKRSIAIAILLGGLHSVSFAQISFDITTPLDDFQARMGLWNRPELAPLADAYSEIIETRLLPLTLDMVPTIFGPRLQTTTDFWYWPNTVKYPSDLVLPFFGHGNLYSARNRRNMSGMRLSGLAGPDHADLHAVGNIGYIELYYKGYHPDTVAAAVIYLRADDKFIPLKSSSDFSKRLKWDKAKFDPLKKWLDEHEPKVTELGLVEVSASSPNRVDLGGGTACVLKILGSREAAVTSNSYSIFLTKEDPDQERTRRFVQVKVFERPGESWVFSVDGKFYRMTPKLVQKPHEPIK